MTSGTTSLTKACAALAGQEKELITEFLSTVGGRPDFRDKAAIFNPDNSKEFVELLDWHRLPQPDLEEQTKSAYEKALYYVGGIRRGLLEREPPRVVFRRVLCLGHVGPPHFITLGVCFVAWLSEKCMASRGFCRQNGNGR